jgi:uncharacterized membrane protein
MECIVLGCILIVVYCSYIEYNTIHSIPIQYFMYCIVLYCSYWVVLYNTMPCSLGKVGILFFLKGDEPHYIHGYLNGEK